MAYSSSSISQNTTVGTMGTFSTATSEKSVEKQKTDFLQMLTFQLKNQNPTKPYDNQEFAQQLATFSQLEQLTEIKSLLNEQAEVFSILAMSMENTALPGMIGKYAKAVSSKLDFDGINPAEIGFKTPYSVSSGTMKIKDDAGNIIKSMPLESKQCIVGEHSIKWDGTDLNGNKLAPGKYTVSVEFQESNGVVSNAQTFTIGKIESVRFKPEGTVLIINGNEVALRNVTDIQEKSY